MPLYHRFGIKASAKLAISMAATAMGMRKNGEEENVRRTIYMAHAHRDTLTEERFTM